MIRCISGSDVLGAWTLLLALTKSMPAVPAAAFETLALSWRADVMGVFEGPASTKALVWRVDLADSASAAQVVAALRGLATVAVASTGSSITVAAGETSLDWALAPPP